MRSEWLGGRTRRCIARPAVAVGSPPAARRIVAGAMAKQGSFESLVFRHALGPRLGGRKQIGGGRAFGKKRLDDLLAARSERDDPDLNLVLHLVRVRFVQPDG